MRRLQQRISWRDFVTWAKFHKVHPLDGDAARDRLLALQVIYAARAAGDTQIQMDDLIPDPFADEAEGIVGLDPVILSSFSGSD